MSGAGPSPLPDPLLEALRTFAATVDGLRDRMQRISQGVNDPDLVPYPLPVAALNLSWRVAQDHLRQPRRRLVREVEILRRAAPRPGVAKQDESYNDKTVRESLEDLADALVEADKAARIAYPGVPPLKTGQTDLDLAKEEAQRVLGGLKELGALLDDIRAEQHAQSNFPPQAETVGSFAEAFGIEIDLHNLILHHAKTTIDLGALVGALELALDLTEDFRSCITDWFGKVTRPLLVKAWDVDTSLRALTNGIRALGGLIEPDPETEFAPDCPSMVLIRPGSFMMGIPEEETEKHGYKDWDQYARPVHRVDIAHYFLLGRFPVTVGEYAEFARETKRDVEKPRFPQNDRHPVVNVSHDDAVAYAEWLSRRTGLSYRLPTEAEWEYACRAGIPTARWWGDEWNAAYANADLKHKGTTEVDRFPPNPWGSHDMIGNVWEWCADPWHERYTGDPSHDGYIWKDDKNFGHRVRRGGSWHNGPKGARAGCRNSDVRENRSNGIGFRLARTI